MGNEDKAYRYRASHRGCPETINNEAGIVRQLARKGAVNDSVQTVGDPGLAMEWRSVALHANIVNGDNTF